MIPLLVVAAVGLYALHRANIILPSPARSAPAVSMARVSGVPAASAPPWANVQAYTPNPGSGFSLMNPVVAAAAGSGGAAPAPSGGIQSSGGGSYSGGGGTTGGGACPLHGAPVRLFGESSWWKCTEVPMENFIEIITESGRQGTFSTTHRMYQRRGLLMLPEWRVGDFALTEDGEERVTSLRSVHIPNATVDRYEASVGHIYSAWGFISHNLKVAV